MKVYKLTNSAHVTKFGMEWGEGKTNRLNGYRAGKGPLCTSRWLHCYEDIRQPLLFKGYHVPGYDVLWEARATGKIKQQEDKMGCTKLTTIRMIPKPRIPHANVRQLVIAAYNKINGIKLTGPFKYMPGVKGLAEELGRVKFFRLLNKHIPLSCLVYPRAVRLREIKRVVGKVVRERKARESGKAGSPKVGTRKAKKH